MSKMSMADLFDWADVDAEYLITLMDTLENYGCDPAEVREEIESYNMEVSEINHWIYTAMHLLNQYIFDNLKESTNNEYYIDLAEEQQDKLAVYTNCLDSKFGNILDQLTFPLDPDEINKKLKPLLDKYNI